jgi:hypothetical protein
MVDGIAAFADTLHQLACTVDEGEEGKLLQVIKNATFARLQVVPTLQAAFLGAYGGESAAAMKQAGELLAEVEGHAVRRYVQRHTLQLNPIVRSGIAFLQWTASGTVPSSPSVWTMHVLHYLAGVRANVAGCVSAWALLASLLENVLQALLDTLPAELGPFSRAQCELDLGFLVATCAHFLSPAAVALRDRIAARLVPVSGMADKQTKETLQNYLPRAALWLRCFADA